MKGISTVLEIIVAAVVLLVVALILLTMMGSNLGGVAQMISDWIKQAGSAPTEVCRGKAQADCSLFRSCSWCQPKGECMKIGEACS